MEEFRIPTKLINMCKSCVQKTSSAIKIEGTMSFFFKNTTGLKQGDPPTPILLNLVLQKVIQNIQMFPSGTKIDKEQLNISAYADGIVLSGKK
jgi:retron-type reverse transcriptase